MVPEQRGRRQRRPLSLGPQPAHRTDKPLAPRRGERRHGSSIRLPRSRQLTQTGELITLPHQSPLGRWAAGAQEGARQAPRSLDGKSGVGRSPRRQVRGEPAQPKGLNLLGRTTVSTTAENSRSKVGVGALEAGRQAIQLLAGRRRRPARRQPTQGPQTTGRHCRDTGRRGSPRGHAYEP